MEDTAVIRPPRVKLGGLWKNKTKTGKQYLSGNLGYDSVIEVWPNIKREGMDGAKDPDYQVFVVQKPKKPSGGTYVPKEDAVDVPF